MCGEFDVVEAGHRKALRRGHPHGLRGGHAGYRHEVVPIDDRGRRLRQLEKPAGRVGPSGRREVGLLDEARGQTRTLKCGTPCGATACGVQKRRRPGDVGDTRVAEPNKMLGRGGDSRRLVQADRGER